MNDHPIGLGLVSILKLAAKGRKLYWGGNSNILGAYY